MAGQPTEGCFGRNLTFPPWRRDEAGRRSDLAWPQEERESTRCGAGRERPPLKHPVCFLLRGQEAVGEGTWGWPLDPCPAPAPAIYEVVVVVGCWKQPGVGSAVTD